MKILHMQVLMAAAAVGMFLSAPAPAVALSVGDKAPDIAAQAAVDGKAAQFDLKNELSKHAVVLYFFPKAFTSA